MAPQLDPITLETAASLIGGEKPISRKTVERIIAAGLLRDYGRGASRRVLRRDVEQLIERLATGEAVWPPGKRRVVPAASRRGGQARGSWSPLSPDYEPLRSRPPKRNLPNKKT